MSLRVEFIQSSPLWRGALPARTLARRAIAAAAAETGVKLRRGAEVAVHLVDDEEIRVRNNHWRGKDESTNVLSFPTNAPEGLERALLLGDILMGFETIVLEARDEGKPLADHFRHLVIHGFLHLLGYDHVLGEDADEMEEIEIRALARLGVPDPYAAAELMDADE